jgi:hypothetical protein
MPMTVRPRLLHTCCRHTNRAVWQLAAQAPQAPLLSAQTDTTYSKQYTKKYAHSR